MHTKLSLDSLNFDDTIARNLITYTDSVCTGDNRSIKVLLENVVLEQS